MNCLYLADLIEKANEYFLPESECRHIKSLRISETEIVMVTNGKGLSATGKIKIINKFETIFKPSEFIHNNGENNFKSGLAIGLLDSRDRLEFAFEKAVELGIKDFYPLITKFTQTNKINIDRLNLKAISAMKQSCRSVLPMVHSPVSLNDLLNFDNDYERILLADIIGSKLGKLENESPTLVVIGPEGGFSKEEIEIFNKDKRVEMIKLGDRRLRSETAAIVALGLVAYK